MLLNWSINHGTWVKSAVLSMNTTTRLPLSIMLPKVGQSLNARVPAFGEKAYWSRPAEVNDWANVVAGRLSMLTTMIVMTSFGLDDAQSETFWR